MWKFRCSPGTVFVEYLQGCDFPDLHPACPLMSTLSPLTIQSIVSTVPRSTTLKSRPDRNLPTTSMLPTSGFDLSDTAARSHSNELNYEDSTSPSSSSFYDQTSIPSRKFSSSSLYYIRSIWNPERKVKWMKTYRTLMDEGLWQREKRESNTV